MTDAIYGAGYNSNGRFYEQSNDVLGMTPTTYRAAVRTPKYALRSASARSARSWSRRASVACARF